MGDLPGLDGWPDLLDLDHWGLGEVDAATTGLEEEPSRAHEHTDIVGFVDVPVDVPPADDWEAPAFPVSSYLARRLAATDWTPLWSCYNGFGTTQSSIETTDQGGRLTPGDSEVSVVGQSSAADDVRTTAPLPRAGSGYGVVAPPRPRS